MSISHRCVREPLQEPCGEPVLCLRLSICRGALCVLPHLSSGSTFSKAAGFFHVSQRRDPMETTCPGWSWVHPIPGFPPGPECPELFVETVSPPEESPDRTACREKCGRPVGWAPLHSSSGPRCSLLCGWALLPMPVLRPEMSPSALLGRGVRAQSSFPGHVLQPAHHCCSLSLL